MIQPSKYLITSSLIRMVEKHKKELEKNPLPSKAGFYFHGYHEGAIADLNYLQRLFGVRDSW